MFRVELENDCFITERGIASGGHWHPVGPVQEIAKQAIAEFRSAKTSSALEFLLHREILDFDARTIAQWGDDSYDGTGFYPQFAWTALEHSGILPALDEIALAEAKIRLDGYRGIAGLRINRDQFKLATELVAQGQEINWDNHSNHCGGKNLLFLYAGNIVSKMYPALPHYKGDLLIESFIFDPAFAHSTR